MNINLPLLLALALPGWAMAAEPSVSVHARMIEVPATIKVPSDITKLYNQRGVDVLSPPSLTTRSGVRCKIEMTRILEVPGKGTFPIGVTLSVLPTQEGNRVRYTMDFDQTQFLGFAEHSATNSPVLETCKIIGMDGVADFDKAVTFAFPVSAGHQIIRFEGKPEVTKWVGRKFVLVLTFTKA